MGVFARQMLAAAMLTATPWMALAQASPPPEPTIIPCEGPNMPAQCPPDANAPRSMDAARQDLAARQAASMQQQLLTTQRLQLRRQLNQNQIDAIARQQVNPANPLLSPPNFRAAAELVNGIVTGKPQ